MTVIAYARVSTEGQELDGQVAALRAAGATQVFSEKESGSKTDRRQLAKAIAALSEGDLLVVTRLDRLARSTRDLLNVLDAVAKRGAGFKSLGDPLIDTSSPHGKLIIAILGALAEFEKSMILARTAEGRRRAMAQGVRFGRRPSLTPHQQAEALRRRAEGQALMEIGRLFNVSHSTIARLPGQLKTAAPVSRATSPKPETGAPSTSPGREAKCDNHEPASSARRSLRG
jgi:DNA invertase Pin-like site-specific DNA recombinase